jgi:hypothetical protein
LPLALSWTALRPEVRAFDSPSTREGGGGDGAPREGKSSQVVVRSRAVRVVVEQVIQTATKVAEGQLTAREAITILATLTPQAVAAARELRETERDRAVAYRELILAIGRELRRHQPRSDEPRHLGAVIDDLTRVHRALG